MEAANYQTGKNSPVVGPSYLATLGKRKKVKTSEAVGFMAQWYAFSRFMPNLLGMCIIKAKDPSEKAHIVANLYSEMGLDTGTKSHPEIFRDLVLKGYSIDLEETELTNKVTLSFLDDLKKFVTNTSPAGSAGLMLALEEVAYDILGVQKEVLEKSGRGHLCQHDYITIHEKVEAEHIHNTEEAIKYHDDHQAVNEGYEMMMASWKRYWDSIYKIFGA